MAHQDGFGVCAGEARIRLPAQLASWGAAAGGMGGTPSGADSSRLARRRVGARGPGRHGWWATHSPPGAGSALARPLHQQGRGVWGGGSCRSGVRMRPDHSLPSVFLGWGRSVEPGGDPTKCSWGMGQVTCWPSLRCSPSRPCWAYSRRRGRSRGRAGSQRPQPEALGREGLGGEAWGAQAPGRVGQGPGSPPSPGAQLGGNARAQSLGTPAPSPPAAQWPL